MAYMRRVLIYCVLDDLKRKTCINHQYSGKLENMCYWGLYSVLAMFVCCVISWKMESLVDSGADVALVNLLLASGTVM